MARAPRAPKSPAAWRTVPKSARRPDTPAPDAPVDVPADAPRRERPPLPPVFDRWSFPVGAAVASVYALRATNGFVYDDFPLIVSQARPRTLEALFESVSQAHWNHLPYYRPLSRLLLAAEHMAFDVNPTPYHLVNAALMGLVAALARSLFSLPELGLTPAVAALAGLLVALHPVASEGVYAASVGPETLACFAAVLGAVVAWTRPGVRAYLAALGLLGAALLFKEQAAALPLVFAWSDLCDLSYDAPGRSLGRWIKRYVPVALVGLAWAGLRGAMLSSGDPVRFVALDEPSGPWLSTLYTLQSIFLPTWRLFYEPPVDGWLSPPKAVVVLAVVVLFGALARRAWPTLRRPVAFWAGWFVFAVLPTANLFRQETRFAERYVLLALPAAVGVLGALFSSADTPERRRPALAALAVMAALAGVVSFHRGAYYATNHAFLEEWRATDPVPYHALASLGEEAHLAHRWAEAERYYRASIAAAPRVATFSYAPLGLVLEAQGRTDEAIEMYRTALRYRPQDRDARTRLAILQPSSPETAATTQGWEQQLREDPNNALALVNLGVAATNQNRLDEAVSRYREALRRAPAWQTTEAERTTMRAKAHYNLGRVLALQGHGPEAIAEYRAALVDDPNYAYAHTNLALLLEGVGNTAEAVTHLRAALRVQPDLSQARTALDRLAPGTP